MLDPNGKFVLWMMVDDEESGQRKERAIVIKLASIPARYMSTHPDCPRGSYHPTLWHPFDTVTRAPDNASDHQCYGLISISAGRP